MTKEKILEVIDGYEKRLETLGTEAFEFPRNAPPISFERGLCLSHIRTMFPKMRKFLEEGRVEKTFRWLGFIQGVLWSAGLYSIEELQNHSRPDNK